MTTISKVKMRIAARVAAIAFALTIGTSISTFLVHSLITWMVQTNGLFGTVVTLMVTTFVGFTLWMWQLIDDAGEPDEL